MSRARIVFSVISLLVTCVVGIASVNAAPYSPVRRSPFQETSYDFKGIPRYTMPRHSFVFTNTGSDDLKLIAARVSCQCTKVFIPEKRVYKPGEKGEVVAQIDGVRFTGVRHVTVTVTFQRGSLVFEEPLQVNGVILENVSLTPQNLTFNVDQETPSTESVTATPKKPSAKDSARTQEVKVVYPGYNERVVRAISSNPYVDVKIGPSTRTARGTQTTLSVSVKNDAPAGYVNAVVQVWSNGANGSTPLAVNVSGIVRAPLTISPPTLTFFTSQDGRKITKNIVISASSDFQLKKVKPESEAIAARFPQKTTRPTRVCVVPITFDPSKLTGNSEKESSEIVIETEDGRILHLATQISSGNFELARKKRSESEEGTAKEDEFADAKVSVSGVQEKISSEAEQTPNKEIKDAEVPSEDGNVVGSKDSAGKAPSAKRDVTPVTLSKSRPSVARRDRGRFRR